MAQDKLTRKQLTDLLRRQDPEYYEDWGDDQLLRVNLREHPEIADYLKHETVGEKLYTRFGDQESADFWKRFGFTFETQWEGMKAGLVGLAPWTSAEAGEKARYYAEELYRRSVAGDTELQAYLAWKEDEPGWTNLHTATRSLSEALPSLAMAMASIPIAAAATATGAPALAVGALSLAPMFLMEGSNQFNEAMKVMVDELGMDAEEAREYAGPTAVAYGVISSLLERIGVKHYAKLVGMGEDVVEGELMRNLTRRLVNAGANKGWLGRQTYRTAAGAARTLEGAMREGGTETVQAILQTSINRGLELGLGETQLEVSEALKQAFSESWKDPAVWEEGFAGATTGVLGFPTGYYTQTGVTSEEIAKEQEKTPGLEQLRRPELIKIAKEEGLKGYSRLKVQDLRNAIQENRDAQAPVDEEALDEAPVDAPAEAPKPGERTIVDDYLDAIIETDNMQDVVDRAERMDDDVSPRQATDITSAHDIQSPGKKILSLVKASSSLGEDVIAKIENSPNKQELLDLARDELNQAIKLSNNPNYEVADDPASVIAALRGFAKRGEVMDVETDQAEVTGEPPSDPTFMYEPGEYQEQEQPPDTGAPPITEGGRPLTEEEMEERAIIGGDPVSVKGAEIVKEGETAQKGETAQVGAIKKEKEKKLAPETPPNELEPGVKVFKNPNLEKTDNKNVGILSKGKNEWQVVETDKETIGIKEVDPKTGKVKGRKLVVPKTIAGRPVLTSLSQKEQNVPDKIMKVKIGGKETALEDEGTTTEAPVEEKQEGTSEDVPLQPGMSVQPNKALIGNMANTKAAQDIKAKLNKLSKGNWEVVSIGTKSYRLKNTETNEHIWINKDVFTKKKDETFPSVLAAKAPLLEDVIEESPQDTRERYLKKTNKQLQSILKDKELPTSGTKAQMAERLVDDSIKEKAPAKTPKKEAPKKVAGTDVKGIVLKQDRKTKKYIARIDGKPYWLLPGETKELKAILKQEPQKAPKIVKEQLQKRKEALEEKIATRVAGLDKAKPAKEDTTKSDLEKEAARTKNDKDLKLKFQDDKTSDEILISEDKELAKNILDRLKKHFPFVDVKTFEGVLNMYGKRRIGFAINKLVGWSTTDGKMDTMPHEFAHIYIKLMRLDPLVKKAIKQFGSEEDLVKYIGLYYTDRMRNNTLFKRIKVWLKQFANRMRRFFGKDVQNLEEFIAEEFFQGRFLGKYAVEGDNFIDFYTQEDPEQQEEREISGEEVDPALTNVASDHHLTHMYYRALGIPLDKKEHYPQMLEIARESNTYEAFKRNLYEWAKKISSDRQLIIKGVPEINILRDITDDTVVKPNSILDQQLRMDWLNSLMKIKRYDPENPETQGLDSRVYHEWTLDGESAKTKGDGLNISGSHSLINKRTFSQTNTKNFIEAQFMEEKSEQRLAILPVKEISRTNVRRENNERFWVRANVDMSLGMIKTLQLKHSAKYLNQVLGLLDIENFGTTKKLRFERLWEEPWMWSLMGSKLGDNAAIISAKVQNDDKPLNITPETYEAFFQREFELGRINENHLDEFLSLSAGLENRKNPLINLSIAEWFQGKKEEKATASEIRNQLKANVTNAINNKYEMSQAIARYKAMQEVRVPDFLMQEKSVADTFTRLSIDMAEGPVMRGLGKSKLMVVPKDTEIEVKDENGDWVTAGTYDDIDGATLVGGSKMSNMGNILGQKRLTQLKTFIRQRTANDDGTVDYIGMKHMMFTPFKNMRFINPNTNEMIAEVTGRGMNTRFVNDSGQTFDMIASRNEAKLMYGKYNDEDYVIHDIEEGSIKVHDIQRKTKTTAAHPIALGEMIMAAAEGSTEAQALLKQIKGRYSEVVKYYTDTINGFYQDSSKLVQFINRQKEQGQVPTELEELLDIIDPKTGKGIWHPSLIDHIKPIINSTVIRDGLYKARAWGRTASKVYLKPALHLKIDEGSMMASSDNSVVVDQVEKAYKKKHGITKTKKQMREYWADEEVWGKRIPHTEHNKITVLNQFLEENEVSVLIHRNPIQKVSAPVLRRVQRILEGYHGQTMFLSWADVKKVLDGDWDGDTAQLEFVSDSYVKAMKNWQQSKAYEKSNKIVSLPIHGNKVEDAVEDEKTSSASNDDLYGTIAENARIDGATGNFVNAKTIMSQLYAKGFKLFHDDLEDSKSWIQVADPESEVIMDYSPLVKENITQDEWNTVTNLNKDFIVDENMQEIKSFKDLQEAKGDVFLKTTKAHEIATLFQMAVDASKYPMFGKILTKSRLDSFEFMLSKIFETNNKKGEVGKTPLFTKKEVNSRTPFHPVSKMMGMLTLVYSTQNISQRRAGINANSKTKQKAGMATNISQSQQLVNRMFDSNGKKRSDKKYSERFLGDMMFKDQDVPTQENMRYDASKHGAFYGSDISMKNVSTPAEDLISGLGQSMNLNKLYDTTESVQAKRHAHVLAFDDLVENATDLKMYDDMLTGKKTKEYQLMYDFLYGDKTKKDGDSFVKDWMELKTDTMHTQNIQSDLNKEFIAFTDKYIDKWQRLPEESRIWATLEMIGGFNDEVHVLKLPPLALMDKGVLSKFFPLFEEHLKAQPSEVGDSLAAEVRKNSTAQATLKTTKKTYKAQDNTMRTCLT